MLWDQLVLFYQVCSVMVVAVRELLVTHERLYNHLQRCQLYRSHVAGIYSFLLATLLRA